MDENIKNLRAAQQETSKQTRDTTTDESNEVDVQVGLNEQILPVQEEEDFSGGMDVLQDYVGDVLSDPMAQEELMDQVVDVEESTQKKTPLNKLLQISKILGLHYSQEALVDDDPAAFTQLLREVRGLAVREYTESDLDLLLNFQKEVGAMKDRVKKSKSETELTTHEVDKLEAVIEKIVNVQEILIDSDLPFILEDTSGLEDEEVDLSNLESMDSDIIDPTDQEQLMDDEIYLVEIQEEEADNYTRWTEPILQLIAVRDPKKLK